MRVWPANSDIPLLPDEKQVYVLNCWQTYFFESSEPLEFPGDRDFAVQIPPFEKPPYKYRANFRDFIGMFMKAGFKFRVTSGKLNEDGFKKLLDDISRRVTELPFDFNSPTFVPFEREVVWGEDLIYHAFLYLRWAALSLPRIYASIAADPYRQLVRTERRVKPWEVRAVSPRTIDQIMYEPHLWTPISSDSPLARTRLAQALDLRLPSEVIEVAVESTLDTPENRFLKYFLFLATELLDRCRSLFKERGCSTDLMTDVEALTDILRGISSHSFLRHVGELKQLPVNSQVLQKRFGYREILSHYQALLLRSRFPFQTEDFPRIVEVKSASKLYEYWSFFEVAEILRQLVGQPTLAWRAKGNDFRQRLEGALNIRFGKDILLSYNHSFTSSQPLHRSYTLKMIPDISLWIGDFLHLFDAKFRIHRLETPGANDADEEDETWGSSSSSCTSCTASDIHKMHVYRDAIIEKGAAPQTVWVLYPGTEFKFYDKHFGVRKEPDLLAASPQGVGAIPLSPMDRTDELKKVLSALLMVHSRSRLSCGIGSSGQNNA